MQSTSLSKTFTSGVGRRILGLFILAGIVPVIVTALLAYFEIGRGIEQQVDQQIRQHSKAFGVAVLSRLIDSSQRADEIVAIIESGDSTDVAGYRYLVNDFTAISILRPDNMVESLHGSENIPLTAFDPAEANVMPGGSALRISNPDLGGAPLLLYAMDSAHNSGNLIAFKLDPGRVWALGENSPYLTEFCAFTASGMRIFCSKEMDHDLHTHLVHDRAKQSSVSTDWTIDGENYLAASWQLFLDSRFAGHPAIDIIAAQPETYALRSSADFRRIFPPAIALVIILVGALSLTLIGESLVPLQR